jgi:hypothetical protein
LLKGNELEAKFLDNNASLALTFNGSLVNAALVPQGSAQSQRLGDSIDVLGLELRWMSNVANVTDVLRVIVIESGAPSGSVTAGTIVAGLTGVTAPVGSLNFTGVRQNDFAVLHDSLHRLSAGLPSLAVVEIPHKNRLQFDAAATSGTGHLFVLFVGGTNAAGGTIQYWTRLFYTDA